MGAGNALAAGQVGQANAINQGVSGITNMYYQNQMLNLLDRNRGSGGGIDLTSGIDYTYRP
jgi:hypothetical protein